MLSVNDLRFSPPQLPRAIEIDGRDEVIVAESGVGIVLHPIGAVDVDAGLVFSIAQSLGGCFVAGRNGPHDALPDEFVSCDGTVGGGDSVFAPAGIAMGVQVDSHQLA